MKIPLEVNEQNIVIRMGKSLHTARINAGQTQDDLAARVGVTRWTIAAMENGDPKVSLAAWIRVSGLLGIISSWDSVCSEEEDPFARYDREQTEKSNVRTRVRKNVT